MHPAEHRIRKKRRHEKRRRGLVQAEFPTAREIAVGATSVEPEPLETAQKGSGGFLEDSTSSVNQVLRGKWEEEAQEYVRMLCA